MLIQLAEREREREWSWRTYLNAWTSIKLVKSCRATNAFSTSSL